MKVKSIVESTAKCLQWEEGRQRKREVLYLCNLQFKQWGKNNWKSKGYVNTTFKMYIMNMFHFIKNYL